MEQHTEYKKIASHEIVALHSPHSLFDENLATFDKSAAFNQNASAGFIELWNLAQKIAYQMKAK